MTNNGLALSLSDSFPADEAIYTLMNYPYISQNLTANAKKLAKPDASKKLGEFIFDIYNEK